MRLLFSLPEEQLTSEQLAHKRRRVAQMERLNKLRTAEPSTLTAAEQELQRKMQAGH